MTACDMPYILDGHCIGKHGVWGFKSSAKAKALQRASPAPDVLCSQLCLHSGFNPCMTS